jgi:hypothetical protein
MNTQYSLKIVALASNDFVVPRRYAAIQSIPETVTVEASFEPEITLKADGKIHTLPGGDGRAYLNAQTTVHYYESLAEVAGAVGRELFGRGFHYSARLDFRNSEVAGITYSFAISSSGAVIDITGL